MELKDDATHEDIENYVNEILQDATDEKGDAQKIAEDRDKPVGDMTAETDSGSADSSVSDDEQTGDSDEQDRKWLDDDLKAEVAAIGIGEEELADFTSREELERALRIFDKTALEKGRQAMAKAEEEPTSAKKPRAKDQESESRPSTEGQYEITLDKDVYGEEVVDEFTRLRDHYEGRLAALESRFTEVDARAEEQLFDSIIDSLGHSDLFGKSGKESSKELQRRQDLFVSVKAHQLGLQQLGRPVDLDSSLVNRVARMVFAEELGKKDLKAKTRKLSKQSDGRMGGGATKPTDPQETLRDWARREYKEREAGTV